LTSDKKARKILLSLMISERSPITLEHRTEKEDEYGLSLYNE